MKRHDPFEMMKASMQMGLMMMEAQSVIAMRLSGMAGLWNVTKGENHRMTAEKAPAMMAAAVAAGTALATGATPAAAVLAALKPIRRRTRANAGRLTKRGPFAKS